MIAGLLKINRRSPIYTDNIRLHGALAMTQAFNGHLLVSNSDGINSDPNQPSEIVEFTIKGQFIGELSLDALPGGAFGLSLVQFIRQSGSVLARDTVICLQAAVALAHNGASLYARWRKIAKPSRVPATRWLLGRECMLGSVCLLQGVF